MSTLWWQPHVKQHAEIAHQVEHEHDTDGHQHASGHNFDHANIFVKTVEKDQKMMKQQTRDQERSTKAKDHPGCKLNYLPVSWAVNSCPQAGHLTLDPPESPDDAQADSEATSKIDASKTKNFFMILLL
jgi:hypothetical protein